MFLNIIWEHFLCSISFFLMICVEACFFDIVWSQVSLYYHFLFLVYATCCSALAIRLPISRAFAVWIPKNIHNVSVALVLAFIFLRR